MIFGEEGSIARSKLDRKALIPITLEAVEVTVTCTRFSVLVGRGKDVAACCDGVVEFFSTVEPKAQAKAAVISNEIEIKKGSFRFRVKASCIFISILFPLPNSFNSQICTLERIPKSHPTSRSASL